LHNTYRGHVVLHLAAAAIAVNNLFSRYTIQQFTVRQARNKLTVATFQPNGGIERDPRATDWIILSKRSSESVRCPTQWRLRHHRNWALRHTPLDY